MWFINLDICLLCKGLFKFHSQCTLCPCGSLVKKLLKKMDWDRSWGYKCLVGNTLMTIEGLRTYKGCTGHWTVQLKSIASRFNQSAADQQLTASGGSCCSLVLTILAKAMQYSVHDNAPSDSFVINAPTL